MKKVLLGTSAIALAGAFATPADAVEWTVRVGGYMEQYVAYQNVDLDGAYDTATFPESADLDGVDSKADAEIYFLPSITLDNGLQFGANVQLEANSGAGGGQWIDESYMFIDGSFGEINLGSENSAGYKMTYTAPDASFVGVNSGSLTNFIPASGPDLADDVFRGTLGASTVETLRNSDIARITYYTPRFAGFQVGASYGRDNTEQSNTSVDCDTNACDFFDLGANYVNSFGDFNVALSGRYGWVDVPSGGNPEVWAVGLNLGYAGFTVGGSYADSDKDHGIMHGRFWDVGVAYETGPWGFSFTYSNGENINDECGVGGCGGKDEEDLEQYLAAVSYALAKGVTLNGFGGYVKFDEECTTAQLCEDMDGWTLGTGVKINF